MSGNDGPIPSAERGPRCLAQRSKTHLKIRALRRTETGAKLKSTQDPVKSTRVARRVLRSLAAQLKDPHTKYVLPMALRLQSCMPTGCSESHPTEMGLGSGQLRLSKASVQLPRLETLRNSFQHLSQESNQPPLDMSVCEIFCQTFNESGAQEDHLTCPAWRSN